MYSTSYYKACQRLNYTQSAFSFVQAFYKMAEQEMCGKKKIIQEVQLLTQGSILEPFSPLFTEIKRHLINLRIEEKYYFQIF